MTEPIVLDTNIVADIARGNRIAAEALRRYIESGTPVYISRAAYNELVESALTPKIGGQYREILNDLNIRIAPAGPMKVRVDVLADNIQHTPLPGRPGQMTEYGDKDQTKPGDAFVAAQVKAVNGLLWTHDQKLIKRAPQFGVRLAPECSIGGVSGPENPDVGRQLLGLNPKAIGPNGQLFPANNSGGGKPGTYSVVGVVDNTLPETSGPSPKGQATIAGIQIAFEGINFVLNLVNNYIQKKRVDESLDRIKSDVHRTRIESPMFGILVLFYYTQYQAPDESIIKPGAAFDYLLWGKGTTRDEALEDIFSTPTISAGPSLMERKFSREVWVPPLQKSASTKAKCPFPQIAVGRFWLGNSNRAKLQLVEFSVIGGFDDVMEKTIELPTGTNANFAVLKAPTQIVWFNKNGRQSVDVPLKDIKTANGNTLKAVDLDPWSPFNAKAVPVFPITDWTEEVFKAVSPTIGCQLLSAYVNFGMIRWIRPENIHLLSFL